MVPQVAKKSNLGERSILHSNPNLTNGNVPVEAIPNRSHVSSSPFLTSAEAARAATPAAHTAQALTVGSEVSGSAVVLRVVDFLVSEFVLGVTGLVGSTGSV